MKRIDQLKARLKAAQAEETIRIKEYNMARKAADKVIKQVMELQQRVREYEAKLAQTELDFESIKRK